MPALALGRFFAEFSQNGRHAFVSAKTQGADATKVSKDEWNSAHALPDIEMGSMAGVYLTSVGVGTNEVFTSPENRWQKRLVQATQLRLQATVTEACPATTLGLQYTTDLTGAAGWTDTGVTLSVATAGAVTSSWVNVPDLAIAAASGVLLRWVTTQ